MERQKNHGKGVWEAMGGRTAQKVAADRERVAEVVY